MTATPPPLVLLCLDECHGEFYLPLQPGDAQVCPNDSEHAVAVYRRDVSEYDGEALHASLVALMEKDLADVAGYSAEDVDDLAEQIGKVP